MTTSPLHDSQRELLAQARAMVAGEPPAPWKRVKGFGAGGVWLGGWDRDENVLIVSMSGYSLTDPRTGERTVRDRDAEKAKLAFSRERLTFTVQATGDTVPIFGAPGGDGLHTTADGWSAEIIYPWWPRPALIMRTPFVRGSGAHGFLDGAHMLDLVGFAGWVRCGFSPSGSYFMVLDAAGATVFAR